MEIIYSSKRQKIKPITIAVDFDNTVAQHRYPKIGKDIPDAERVLKLFQNVGHKIILSTMRDNKELADAVYWFNKRGIELYGVNENPDQKSWTTSPKVLYDFLVDDRAAGCPMKTFEGDLVVDWNIIEIMAKGMGLIM